jgi:PAS domain S-box-containing protein
MQIRPTRAIGVLATVTITLIAIAVTLLLQELRQQQLSRARLETVSLAHMFREQTERTFDRADAVLRGVQERMQTAYGARLPLDGTAVHLLLAARIFGNPQLSSLTLVDESGMVINSSLENPVTDESVAAADYFRAFVDDSGGPDTLFVGPPALNRTDGTWTLRLARQFAGVDGKFRGVVVAVMIIPRFDQFYSWMKLDYERPIALYMADGTLVASVPHRENMIGDRAPELDASQLPATSNQVRMVTHTRGDGGRVVFALARAGRFPLLVSVTNDEEPALAAWREASVPIVLGALLVAIFIVAAAVLLARELAREAVLARALRDAHDRYHRTIDSVMDAIVAVDENYRIILFNPAAARMFGVTAAEMAGAPLDRLLPKRVHDEHRRHVDNFRRDDLSSRAMSPNVEITGVRADGSEFPIESTISRTLVDGKPQLTAVLRDVTQRRRAESDLREMNRQLRGLSQALQNVREEERTRIAMELHDDLGQQLTGLKLELSWLGGRLKEGRPATSEAFDAMRRQLDAAISSVRRIAAELRPLILGDLGFAEAVAWQARELSRRSGLEIALELDAAGQVTDDVVATALFRIVQESLTNIARHSGATRVSVRLLEEGGELVLTVHDNGKGIAVQGKPGKGIGLVSMRERTTALGGRFRIASIAGAGTTIEVALPMRVSVTEEES